MSMVVDKFNCMIQFVVILSHYSRVFVSAHCYCLAAQNIDESAARGLPSSVACLSLDSHLHRHQCHRHRRACAGICGEASAPHLACDSPAVPLPSDESPTATMTTTTTRMAAAAVSRRRRIMMWKRDVKVDSQQHSGA